MNISLFASPIAGHHQLISDLVREQLELSKVVRPPVTIDRTENVGNIVSVTSLDQITSEGCVSKIQRIIDENPGADEYIFIGAGLSLYVSEISAQYPSAKVYISRFNYSGITLEVAENKKFLSLSKKTGIPKEDIRLMNEAIKTQLTDFVTSKNISYQSIDMKFSNELAWIDTANNTVIRDFNDTHVRDLVDLCELAIYDPAI